MAMELKQSLRMSQQLVMTPQLQQAIKLLQLSRMELLEQVREEMEQNPLLEKPGRDRRRRPRPRRPPARPRLEAANVEAPLDVRRPRPRSSAAGGQGARGAAGDRLGRLPQQLPVQRADHRLEQGQRRHRRPAVLRGQPGQEGGPVRPPRRRSSACLKLNDAERRVAELIIGNLDDDGYLKLPDVEGDPLIRLANEADVPHAGWPSGRCGRSSSSTRRAAARATSRSACSSRPRR